MSHCSLYNRKSSSMLSIVDSCIVSITHTSACEQICKTINEWKTACTQYWPEVLQHLHARKMRAIWRIYTRVTRKIHSCNFLHELLHELELHEVLRVFRAEANSWINTRALRVFFSQQCTRVLKKYRRWAYWQRFVNAWNVNASFTHGF